MAKYIEREALIKRLKSAGAISDWGLYLIKDEPAADVRPERHAEWLYCEEGIWECSECGEYGRFPTIPFCCKCGAKMDGKDGECNE